MDVNCVQIVASVVCAICVLVPSTTVYVMCGISGSASCDKSERHCGQAAVDKQDVHDLRVMTIKATAIHNHMTVLISYLYTLGVVRILFKMATGRSGSSTQQEGIIDYNDIMIIGKTGMGKTTTADKLLVAKPHGRDYQGAEHSEPVVDNEHVRVEDLSIWLLSDAPNEIERVKHRLKNLAFFRSLGEPHEEINKSHSSAEGDNTATLSFELMSNESTKVRVLDVPGFFGEGDAGACIASPGEKAQHSVNVAVGRMRMILQIQATMRINFRRILYFLPLHGALKRSDAYLEFELTTLAKYFGKSIFNSMVVAATMPEEAFEDGNLVTFSGRALAQTKQHFAVVLSRVFPQERNLPDPPVVFVSMADTCEAVLAKILNAPVACDRVVLEFVTQVCARCGSRAKVVHSEKVAVYTDESETDTIPYDESSCHPLFIPKYTKVDRIIGGIVHLITLGLGRWSNFRSLHEECVRCKKQPGSRGCTLVNTKCELYRGQYFKVDHTNNTTERIAFEFKDVTPDQKIRSGRAIAEGIQTRSPRSVTSAPIDTVTREEDEASVEEPIGPAYLPTQSYLESKGT